VGGVLSTSRGFCDSSQTEKPTTTAQSLLKARMTRSRQTQYARRGQDKLGRAKTDVKSYIAAKKDPSDLLNPVSGAVLLVAGARKPSVSTPSRKNAEDLSTLRLIPDNLQSVHGTGPHRTPPSPIGTPKNRPMFIRSNGGPRSWRSRPVKLSQVLRTVIT